MNTEQLQVGDIYKNYKTLCAALEEPIKTGKSKQLQIADWERFFEYKKAGNSFIIEKIHEIPKTKPKGNNTIKYLDKIEKLILDLLVQDGNDGQVFLSKNKLLKTLKMVNENYSFGKSKPFKLSKLINIAPEGINEFYEVSDGMLKRNLETALNNLRKQALITWKSSLTVCHIETEVAETHYSEIKATKTVGKDKYGDEEVKFGIHNPTQTLIHRRATVEEEKMILRAEREVLLKHNCKSVSDIFRMCKGDIFYQEVREILFDISNIYLYYNSYEIISNKDMLLEEWNLQEKSIIQTELNDGIVEKIENNAENRHKNAFAKHEETKKRKYEFRKSDDYLENNKKLTETLIQKDAKIIRYL